MRLKISFILFALLGLGLSLLGSLGCGPFDPFEIAEDAIEDYLAEAIGPADHYDVRISRGGGTRLGKGFLSRVWIRGRNVRVMGGLILKNASAELQEVQVDLRQKRLKALGNSKIRVEITDRELTRYLKRARPHLQDLNLTFSQGRIHLTARPVVLFNLTVPVEIEGSLFVSSPETVSFEPDQVKVAIINVPSPIIQWMIRQINPVFDVRELRLPVILEEAFLQPGLLALEGRVEVNQLP